MVCTGAIKRTETIKLINDLEWDSLKIRRKRAKLVIFYKIKNGLVPHYLMNMLPVNEIRVERYNLRHVTSTLKVKIRLKCYQTSFFPSTYNLWNTLSTNILGSNSVNVFKKSLTKCSLYCDSFDRYPKSYLFGYCSGFYGRILNQIRYELSPLKSHLFTYGIIDDQMCPMCTDMIESTNHYFLKCTSYLNCRINLKHKLMELLVGDDIVYDQLLRFESLDLLTLFLCGSASLSNNINREIFEAVVRYMHESRRFKKRVLK